MKKLIILISVILLGGLGWWLISPLFIDKVVEEDFPIVTTAIKTENEAELANQAHGEMIGPMAAHGLNQEKIDAMTEEKRMAMEQKIVGEMAALPDIIMEEEFDQGSIEPMGDAHSLDFKTGSFVDADGFHKGSGEVSMVYRIDGSFLLRFESVNFTNGPDLRVYLTKELNPTKEQVKNGFEVAELKGNKGSHNYPLPENFNLLDYNAVVIYCKPFGVVFSIANLADTAHTDSLKGLFEQSDSLN